MRILLCLAFILNFSHAATSDEARSLLEKSDRARGGMGHGVEWDLDISSLQNGQTKDSTFHVKAKGVNVLAVCTAPARQKGETYLFNDHNLWVYRSNLRKPISISTRVRLSGQTSNGDIANTNYAKDYEAEILAREVIGSEKAVKLLLKAKTRDLTYDQIHYWVAEKSGLALQAEFLTLEGKPIKRATFTYNNSIEVDGKKAPFISNMLIIESAFPENKSTLTYKNLTHKTINDSIFNVNNLSR